MKKRFVAAAASLAAFAALAVAVAPSASAAPHGGTCTLQGSANFDNPLTGNTAPFTYSFTGSLSNCQSSSGGPGSGTIEVGVGGLPHGSGSGSCSSSTTSGTGVISWADGKTTVISYQTTGAAAAVVQQGSVVQSVTYTPTGSSTPVTVTTNEPSTVVGDSADGLLTFSPPNPQGCAPGGSGVTQAAINGQTGIGATS
jgi:hypothetical protein